MRIPTFLAVAGFACVTLAQQVDPQTADYEKQDEVYLQRMLENTKADTGQDTDLATGDFRRLTEELMRSPGRRSRSGEHYTIRSDDPRVDLDAALELLESLHAYLDRSPPGGIELHDGGEPCAVFLFHSSFQLRQLPRKGPAFRGDDPLRIYHRPSNTIAIHSDGGGNSELAEALLDLASHQLVERRIVGKDGQPSGWIKQGLAHYLAFTFRDRHGEFRTGRVGGKSTRLLQDSQPDRGQAASRRLRDVRDEIRRNATGDGTMLEEYLAASGSRGASRSDPELNYGIGWGLVHYLLHDTENRYNEAFSRYLSLDLGGHGDVSTLFQQLSTTPAELESGMRTHVLSQKIHPRVRWFTGRAPRLEHTR